MIIENVVFQKELKTFEMTKYKVSYCPWHIQQLNYPEVYLYRESSLFIVGYGSMSKSFILYFMEEKRLSLEIKSNWSKTKFAFTFIIYSQIIFEENEALGNVTKSFFFFSFFIAENKLFIRFCHNCIEERNGARLL